ncbi:MAG: hypothetical protein ACRDWN_03190 [Acidimicrobiales bacterium]
MKLHLHVGNLLELASGAFGVWAAWRYLGLTGALVVAAVLCVVAAELLYDDVVWTVPLPPVGRGVRRTGRAVAAGGGFLYRAVRSVVRDVGQGLRNAARAAWRVVEHTQP